MTYPKFKTLYLLEHYRSVQGNFHLAIAHAYHLLIVKLQSKLLIHFHYVPYQLTSCQIVEV